MPQAWWEVVVQMTRADIASVMKTLERIDLGGEVSFEEVQSLRWDVPPEIDPLIQQIYRELQMFASDIDLRSADREYDASWRRGLRELSSELIRRLGQ
jgi:hypothetical protein